MLCGDGHAHLSCVSAAAEQLARHLRPGTVVTTKFTVPVGTGKHLEEMIGNGNLDAHVSVCSNPEFLREGSGIEDFRRPDRLLLGRADSTLMRNVRLN